MATRAGCMLPFVARKREISPPDLRASCHSQHFACWLRESVLKGKPHYRESSSLTTHGNSKGKARYSSLTEHKKRYHWYHRHALGPAVLQSKKSSHPPNQTVPVHTPPLQPVSCLSLFQPGGKCFLWPPDWMQALCQHVRLI